MLLLAQASVTIPSWAISAAVPVALLVLGALVRQVVGNVLKRQDDCEQRSATQEATIAKQGTDQRVLETRLDFLEQQLAASRRTNEILERQTVAFEQIGQQLRARGDPPKGT